MAHETPNTNSPQTEKPGMGKPNQAPHKPDQQQDQTSGVPGQQGGDKPPAKPQQG